MAEIIRRYPPFRHSPETTAAIAFLRGQPVGFATTQELWPTLVGFPWRYGYVRGAQKTLAHEHQVYVIIADKFVKVVSADEWTAYQIGRSKSGGRIRRRAGRRMLDTPRVLLSTGAALARDVEALTIEALYIQEQALTAKRRALSSQNTEPTKLIEMLFPRTT